MRSTQEKTGFPPIFNEHSRVLILGSFPSVKSRAISFYYGNPQNRFWKMLCGYFGETIPTSTEGKREFLLRRGVALWDMVRACEIEGSADASIQNEDLVDLQEIFQTAKIEKILLNGALAYRLFVEKYPTIEIPYRKMSSTSPANPRYDEAKWWEELRELF